MSALRFDGLFNEALAPSERCLAYIPLITRVFEAFEMRGFIEKSHRLSPESAFLTLTPSASRHGTGQNALVFQLCKSAAAPRCLSSCSLLLRSPITRQQTASWKKYSSSYSICNLSKKHGIMVKASITGMGTADMVGARELTVGLAG